MSETVRRQRNPDKEPWPYPPGYILAPRNPTVLTVIGSVLFACSLGLFGWILYLVFAPSGPHLTGTLVFCGLLFVGAGAFTLRIGIIRLRWQRSYLARHGVLPVLIGSKPK
jgi:hypothetical protein